MKVPTSDTAVYKDECLYGFDTPEAEKGLFLNLTSLWSVGAEFLEMDIGKTGGKYYLHQKWVKVPKEKSDGEGSGEGGAKAEPEVKTVAQHLKKLAEEGDGFETHKTHSIYCVETKKSVPYPFAGISEHL